MNNAGAARVHLTGVPDEEWEDSLAINFLSAVRVTTAALQASDRAAIVSVSSGVSANPPALVLHYETMVGAMGATAEQAYGSLTSHPPALANHSSRSTAVRPPLLSSSERRRSSRPRVGGS